MADLGSIGMGGGKPFNSPSTTPSGLIGGAMLAGKPFDSPGSYVRSIVLNSVITLVRGEIDYTIGNPAPSQRMDAIGPKPLRWIVQPGSRSISVDVFQPVNQSPRPTLVVKANANVGLNADIVQTAGSSTGWVTITASFTCTAAGAVEVRLLNNYEAQYGTAQCWWDNVTRS